jgi:hypothetical protein
MKLFLLLLVCGTAQATAITADQPAVVTTTQGYLNVKGIEKWILTLQPKRDSHKDCSPLLMMQDPETKDVFAIRRED